MKRWLGRIVDLGVPANMSPEEAKYIQMSNLGSLLMMLVNVPYMALCLIHGWILVFFELCALDLLLFLTALINRQGRHLLALFYFGTLLNIHLVFVTVAMGREALLQLLIFFTAGGAITLIRRGKTALMVAALAGILATYQLALVLERVFGPLYRLDPGQTASLRLFVVYSLFALVVVNALIGRFGAIVAENRLRQEQKRSEQLALRVQEQDRQKTQFFQNVSHELRTPLTLILGPLESLLAGGCRSPQASCRSKLQMMERNARRLLRLINQMLDLSRIAAGKTRLKAARGDLVKLVDDLVRSFADYAEKQGIKLSLQSTLADPQLDYDQEIIEKIVSNLLSNACRFTSPGGEVRVGLSDGPGARAVRVSIRDSGVGMTADELEHIFDRFYQTGGTRAGQGAGIGLNLVKELVEIHGGTIAVSSVPGAGSEFVLSLPRQQPHPGAQAAGLQESAPRAGLDYARMESAGLMPLPGEAGRALEEPPQSRATVLVVEDSPDMRQYIRQGLEPHFRVLEAPSGEEALSRAREHLPNLILSDVMMPGMDGYALCRALRGEPRLSLIPVILLTARASADMVIQGLESGAVDHIGKPFSFDVLLAKIRGLLEREQQQERIALRDGLTGLLNRQAWEQEAERELKRIERCGGAASIAFLDLDDFKRVNDNHGHQVGDQVLVELARTVVEQLRATDLVGRYGGEEFVLLLPDSSGQAAVGSVERILQLFRDRAIGGQALHCAFSAGVVEIRGLRLRSLAEYVTCADEAMYRAKKKGKARVLLWGEETAG